MVVQQGRGYTHIAMDYGYESYFLMRRYSLMQLPQIGERMALHFSSVGNGHSGFGLYRLLKNSMFTLREPQGERSECGKHCGISVHAEPVEAWKIVFQQPVYC